MTILIGLFFLGAGGLIWAWDLGKVVVPKRYWDFVLLHLKDDAHYVPSPEILQALASLPYRQYAMILAGAGGFFLLLALVRRLAIKKAVLSAPLQPASLRLEHQASEVTHGGDNRFHQVCFDFDFADHPFNTERVLFETITGLAQVFMDKTRPEDRVTLSQDPAAAELYLALLPEAGHVSWSAFLNWARGPLAQFQRSLMAIRKQAINESLRLGLPALDSFSVMSLSTLAAQQTEEALTVYYEDLSSFKGPFSRTLGRALSQVFRKVDGHPDIQTLAHQKLGADRDLLAYRFFSNPLVCRSLHPSDENNFLEELDSPTPYPLLKKVPQVLDELFQEALTGRVPLTLPPGGLAEALAAPENLKPLLSHPVIARRLSKALASSKEGGNLLCLCREVFYLQDVMKAWAQSVAGAPRTALEMLASPRRLRLLLNDAASAKKAAQEAGFPPSILHAVTASARAVKKRTALRQGVEPFRHLFSGYFMLKEDLYRFRKVRETYGSHPRRPGELLNLRVLRIGQMVRGGLGKTLFDYSHFDQRTLHEVRNYWEEGRLLRIVPSGAFFLDSGREQRKTLFLFADLRNSTETTMRLTRDTAGYLAPYLTTVNSSARANGGERIYFAGDGFACHYKTALQAVRTCWVIHQEFVKLRQASTEEIGRKMRERLVILRSLPLQLFNKRDLDRFLEGDGKKLDTETRDILLDLAQSGEDITTAKVEAFARRKVEENAMPKVEAGIGITAGDLVFALVGEAQEEKLKIVISPQLTMAARVSGSSAEAEEATKKLPGFVYKAHVHDGKLFNRGVVLTDEVYQMLGAEVRFMDLPGTQGLKYFFDAETRRCYAFRRLDPQVLLKGIGEPVTVHEMIVPGSAAAQLLPQPKT